MKNLITLCAIIFLSTTLFSQQDFGQDLGTMTHYGAFESGLHMRSHKTDMLSRKYASQETIKRSQEAEINFKYASNKKTIVEILSLRKRNSFVVEGFEYKKKSKRGNNIYESTAYDDLDLEHKIILEIIGGSYSIDISLKITIENKESGESLFYY